MHDPITKYVAKKKPILLRPDVMTSDPVESRTLLQNALEAFKRGDRVTAQRLAQQAASLAPETEEPWLILAALAGSTESLAYVKKALEINPESKTAQKALEWALSQPGAQPPVGEVAPPSEEIHPPTRPDSLTEIPASQLTQRKKGRFFPTRTFLFALLGLLVIALIAELVFLRLMLSRFLADPSPHTVCNSSLVIGKLSILVEPLKPGSDGALHYPSTFLYRAYWVEGTFTNPVFLVSPAPDNQYLVTSFGAGETATVTWANCNTASYRLSSPAPGSLDSLTLLDQSTPQITIFFPTSTESKGLVIHGALQRGVVYFFGGFAGW